MLKDEVRTAHLPELHVYHNKHVFQGQGGAGRGERHGSSPCLLPRQGPRVFGVSMASAGDTGPSWSFWPFPVPVLAGVTHTLQEAVRHGSREASKLLSSLSCLGIAPGLALELLMCIQDFDFFWKPFWAHRPPSP